MKTAWLTCLRHWKHTLQTAVRQRPGRRGTRRFGLGSRSVQVLEGRLLLAGDVDDQIAEAINLGSVDNETTIEGTIEPGANAAADVDLYRFTVVAGQRVAFDIDHDTDDFNSVIRLFSSAGSQLAGNDNAAAPGEDLGSEAYLAYTFKSAGTYYLGVSGFGNNGYNAVTGAGDRTSSSGDYTLTLTALDPDDQLSEAVNIGTLLSQLSRASTVDFRSDVDVLRFTGSAGQRVGIDVDRAAGSQLDSFLRLFDASGTELASNDNAPATDESLGVDSYLSSTLPASGDYYVAVSGAGNGAYDIAAGTGDTVAESAGAFLLQLTFLDADDQLAEATDLGQLLHSATVTAAIELPPDVDLYRFTVVAGQTLSFDVDHVTSEFNSVLRLFASTGTQLKTNDNAAAPGETLGTEAYVSHKFTSTGTYYIGVSGASNARYNVATGLGDSAGSSGSYLLAVTAVDSNDQISEAATPRTLLGRLSNSDTLDSPVDVDIVPITVDGAVRVAIDIDRAARSTLNSYLRVFDGSGTELAANDNAAAPGETSGTDSYLEYAFADAGTYHIAVSASGNSDYDAITGGDDQIGTTSGAYSVVISYLDPDDQLTEATALGALIANATPTGNIDVPADLDLLSFTVVSGQRVSFDVDHTTLAFDSYLRIFGSNGRQIAANDNGAASDESLGSEAYLVYTFTSAGTYYVAVSGAGNRNSNVTTGEGDVAGSTGGYTLNIVTIDPDDQLTEAGSLGTVLVSTARSSIIELPLDVDLFAFTAVAGQRLTFDVDRSSASTLDTLLRVFDAGGTEVAANNDAAAPGETASTDSFLSFDVASSGTYYVGVSAAGNTAYDAAAGTGDSSGSTTGSYTLTVSFVDFDDQLSEAVDVGAISDNLSYSGVVSVATDVDLLKFTVVAGQRLEFDIDHPEGSGLNSYLRIFNATGQQLGANDNGRAPGESLATEAYLGTTFATAGDYYVGVSHSGNRTYSPAAGTGDATNSGSAGGYTLSISILDTDDQISEAVNLGAITSFVRRDAAIDAARDVDLYRFTVNSGQQIGFDIDAATGSSLDSYLTVFDANGNVLSFNDDGAASGESDSGDSYVTYTFTSSGTYYVAVSSTENQDYDAVTGTGDSAGSTGSYSLVVQVVPDASGFQIELSFSGLTASQQAIFQQAAQRWSQVIIGDLPDVTFNGRLIDDVFITARGTSIDGVGRVLGQAGPTYIRSSSSLPFLGEMEFDSADLASLESNGSLLDVVIHEMGHVLGIGTLWSRLGLLSGAGTSNPIFTGAQATAAYNRIFNVTAAGVPVENGGGAGTRDAHWRESVLGLEVMSGYLSAQNRLTEITIGSLADMGYVVDISVADLYPL